MAAHNPPGRRLLHLAKLDERFRAGSCTFNLAANENRSGFRETGFIHLQRVRVEPFPTFTYSFKDISLDKTVFLVHGENSTVILYRVYNGTAPAVLSLVPLVNGRGHHCVTRRDELQFKQKAVPGGVSIAVAGEDLPDLLLTCSAGTFIPGGSWYEGMFYRAEKERGENDREDHYVPGRFEVPIASGEVKTLRSLPPLRKAAGQPVLTPWIYWKKSGPGSANWRSRPPARTALPAAWCGLRTPSLCNAGPPGKKPSPPAIPGLPTGAGTP